MTLRKLLVPFGPTEGSRQALQMAFFLARTFSAHVEVLHVRPDPQDAVPLLGEGVSGAMVEELMSLTEKESAAGAAQAQEMFEQQRTRDEIALADRPPSAGPTTRWLEVVGREEDMAVERGHVADLIVMGRAESAHDATAAATMRASLFESGRPVLLAPAAPPSHIGRCMAIAWNDSGEATRAVASALPLLERAETVHVFTASSEKTAAGSAHDLVDFLAWHGIDARIDVPPEGGGAVGEALLEAASAAGVDMLVMGAYTHSRLRQLILGGVTHHVLDHARIPLLMAH